MNQIKAIETFYRGYHFRSRLEARWAVFFDTLDIPWKYEVEGFEREIFYDNDAPTIVRYLPDFFLPNRWGGGVYVEVKGDKNALKKDWHENAQMHDYGGILPNFNSSRGKSDAGLLLLSDIPEASQTKIYFHPIIQHEKGLVKSYAFFGGDGLAVVTDSQLARMLDVEPVYGLDYEEDNWGIDLKQAPTDRHYPNVVKAYAAARAARFEHGQQGTK
jgi:hypothetical protein